MFFLASLSPSSTRPYFFPPLFPKTPFAVFSAVPNFFFVQNIFPPLFFIFDGFVHWSQPLDGPATLGGSHIYPIPFFPPLFLLHGLMDILSPPVSTSGCAPCYPCLVRLPTLPLFTYRVCKYWCLFTTVVSNFS